MPSRELALFQQVEAVVVDPPDCRHHDESADGGDDVGRRPGDIGQCRGDADHRFAQHDDGQQADPLHQVRRVRRHDMQSPVQQHQGRHVEHDPGVEHQVAPRRLEQDRGKADQGADGEHGAHRRREATPVVVLALRDEVHRGDHQPRPAVAGHGQRVMLLGARRDLCRDHDQQEHDQQGREPVLAVVGVEAIGVDRVARPDPPQRQEHQYEVQELLRRDVAVVRFAQDVAGVAQGDDENQVEEQLEPGCAPVVSKYRVPSRDHHRPSSPCEAINGDQPRPSPAIGSGPYR